MRLDDLDSISSDPSCSNPVSVGGDPDYYGTAAGFYCLPDSGLGVVLRYYDDPSAVSKVIGDWSELVSEENQIVFSGNWFATGPREVLLELFSGFEKNGPQATLPDVRPMSPRESDLTLCSSVAYGVIGDSLSSPSDGSQEDFLEYYEAYPELDVLVTRVGDEARDSGVEALEGDDLLATAFVTRWDARIKGFCRDHVGQ